MIQEALFTRLSTNSNVTALIGTNPMRLYPRLLDEEPTYPAVTYIKVSETRERAMGADPGLVHARFQFDVWDANVDSARNVTEQLRLALERARFSANGTTVQDTFIDNVQEPGPELVNAVPVFHTITDVMVFYQE